MRRWFITVTLLKIGFIAGLAAAAAAVRAWIPSRGDESSDELALLSIFNGVELHSRAAAFRGGSVIAWFAGVEVDLRDATLAPGAHLDVRALFAGVAITVPPGWRVQHEGSAFAGGISVAVPEPDDPNAPPLTVRATSIAGGVEIAARAAAQPA